MVAFHQSVSSFSELCAGGRGTVIAVLLITMEPVVRGGGLGGAGDGMGPIRGGDKIGAIGREGAGGDKADASEIGDKGDVVAGKLRPVT